jgi:hypothetical protein
MTKLTEVLREQDPTLDQEDGHHLAYTIILQASQAYEHPPVFVSEDSEQLQSDPETARRVAEWMNTAAKVASGNRRRVLEDGRDVIRSDEEDAISPKEAEPDEEHGMYAPGCTSLDQAKMTEEQAQAQGARAKVPPRSQTPVGSSDDDDPNVEDLIWSQTRHYWRPNKNKKPTVAAPAQAPAPISEPEPVRQPTPLTSPMNSEDEGMSEDQRRMVERAKKMAARGVPRSESAPNAKSPKKTAATQKAPAPQPIPEAKASTPRKGQESPETKVSHPMQTRGQEASGAGGLRGVVGSGSTGYVCGKLPPSFKPGP